METLRHPLYDMFLRMLRQWKLIALCCAVFIIVFTVFCNELVERSTKARLFTRVEDVPPHDVGLLLGANIHWRYSDTNLYMKYRIDAAVALFKAGKIKRILVSGDNHTSNYDEPTTIKTVLLQYGVPDSCITLDYAGFRTLDSVVRCKWIFGQNNVLIISQEFHDARALFLADAYGLKADAFCAKDVGKSRGLRTKLREYLARVSAVLDVYVMHTEPHFFGKKESL